MNNTIEQLNARARALYTERAQNATEEPDQFAVLETCLDQTAAEFGFVVLHDAPETEANGTHTRIYQNEAGEIVNCWLSSENEEISQTDFSGLGFDDQTDWANQTQ